MRPHLAIMMCAVASALAGADLYQDATGDAVFRRTDAGNNGLIPPGVEPIDLVSFLATGWSTSTPQTDPFNGHAIEDGDLARLQLVLDGVVAPPGPLGFAGAPYDPFRFGPRPVYGFIDLDIDGQKNSGGEFSGNAQNRYLANVARFGMTPEGSISERVPRWGLDLDASYYSGPQYERTGAEMTLTFCGCWEPTIVSQSGNGDGHFDSGESWVIRGRFFQRADSFSSVSSLYGGSDFGTFDPLVNLRWSHDAVNDVTSVELVFPLTMHGAAMLAGQADQAIDNSLLNHTSMEEMLTDLIDNAEYSSGVLHDLWDQWEHQDVEDYLHPREWEVRALVGTAYASPEPDARYIWTDVGFNEVPGDVDGDSIVGGSDTAAVESFIAAYDSGPWDCDGSADGQVTLCEFANNFCLYDFDYDGVVSACDAATLGHGADLNSDGLIDFFDVSAFLQAFSSHAPLADWNGDGLHDFFDVSAYLQVFSSGCP